MSWFLTHIVLVSGYLIGFLCTLALLRHPRHRQGVGLWLLGMLLVPYLAVPLFLVFGGRKYRKIIKEKGGRGRVRLMGESLVRILVPLH